MKKTIIVYFLMIMIVLGLTLLMGIESDFLRINFSHILHVAVESLILILMLSIFFVSNSLFLKTKDERFIILAGGFLICLMLNLIHIFTVTTFPYDNLYLNNIVKNPTLIYLLMSNIILPLSVYFSLIYKPLSLIQDNCRLKIYINYVFLFLILTISPILIYHLFPNLLYKIYIIAHSLEYINYALWLMLASILINLRLINKQPCLNVFITGLLIMGLGGLFYINPMSIQLNALLAHIFQIIALVFILIGISQLKVLAELIKFKDEFIAHLSLLLIAFYVVFVAIASGYFKVVFPQYSGYLFVVCLLLFQLVIYIFSTISWNTISKVYTFAERNESLMRVFESLRRISNPDIIKNTIVDEIKKEFKMDKCFIALYNPSNNSFYFDRYLEKMPSKMLVNFNNLDEEVSKFDQYYDVFKNNIQINFSNVKDYIVKSSLKGTIQEELLTDLNIKSIYSIPINYANKLLGYLIIHYTSEYKELNKDDLAYLLKMANQIGIAINQANKT